jgi:hypothetical protein
MLMAYARKFFHGFWINVFFLAATACHQKRS